MNRDSKKELWQVIISAFLCAALFMADAFALPRVLSVNITESGGTALKETEKEIEKKAEDTASEDSEKTEKAVETAGSDVKIGEIQNKFITPYTANTSYNNVYLKNSTELKVNLKELLEENINFKIEKNGEPQVLIVHTHATESFMTEDRDYYTASDKSRSTDNSRNMVAVGKVLADKLNKAGIVTLQSETQHDYPDYNYSYYNSEKTVKEYIEKYPSIKIVLDMHRDAIGASPDKVKITTKIGGKSAAQVMLVMGSQSGGRTDYPNYRENLKLAVRLQQTLEIMHPGLARAINFGSFEYNQSLHPGSMLIEMGTDANTLEEVKYSAELVGDALISLCNALS